MSAFQDTDEANLTGDITTLSYWVEVRHRQLLKIQVAQLTISASLGGVGKSCLTGKATRPTKSTDVLLLTKYAAQFVQNVWIETYDPTIEDSYRKQIEVSISNS